jgi:murein DD-endopeptidase MepM/ murein hydrolase activator NlpD
MIFHAPQTNASVVALVLRRTLFNRPAIFALGAVVSTSVVLAGRGADIGTDGASAAISVSKSSLSSISLGLPGGKVQNPIAETLSVRAATLPDALQAPVPMDFPLVEELSSGDDAPDTHVVPDFTKLGSLRDDLALDFKALGRTDTSEPSKPRNVEVASLRVPDIDWSPLRAPTEPEAPSLKSAPSNPSLKHPQGADSAPTINHLDTNAYLTSLIAADGETLEALLLRADLDDHDRKATLIALRADNITEVLFGGDVIDIATLSEDDNQLLAIRLRQSRQPPVELRWDGDTAPLWTALDTPDSDQAPVIVQEAPKTESLSITGRRDDTVLIEGQISSSLYASATKVGLTAGEAKALSGIFRYSVDFERDLRKGDRFEALYEKKPNGAYGNILYAKLTNRGSEIALYRGIDDVTGEVGYFDATGKTNKRSLMRTPLAGAQVSSHFGMRMHPVLGYSKMHRGTDFRARRGTPIFAAGDGIVDSIGRKGAYGEYIRIRHNDTYETAYAHLSRYADGLNYGDRVRQGDVIGYVGSTGRSTGPHLHFEILKHGNQINPLEIADFGPVRGLSGAALSAFLVRVSRIEIALTLMRKDSAFATAQ